MLNLLLITMNQKRIVLFDGVCNLCNGFVNFILNRDNKKQFQFIPLQSERGQELISMYDIPRDTDSVILIAENVFYIESTAAIEIIRLLPVPWKWFSVFRYIPLKQRNNIYQWVARNRYKWFGKRDTCRIVPGEKSN